MVCYCFCQGQGQTAVTRVAQRIIECNPPSLQDLHVSRTHTQADNFVADLSPLAGSCALRPLKAIWKSRVNEKSFLFRCNKL